MARKHHKPEEIVLKLRQVDVLVGQGMARPDAIRQVSITEQTYYRCDLRPNSPPVIWRIRRFVFGLMRPVFATPFSWRIHLA